MFIDEKFNQVFVDNFNSQKNCGAVAAFNINFRFSEC